MQATCILDASMITRRLLVLAVLLLALFGAPTRPRAEVPAAPLTVLAAASLTESLQKVGAAWQAKGNGTVTFSFDASSRLAKQVQGGVPADAFFSADLEWLDFLDQKGLVVPGSRVVLLGNTLVAVVGTDSTFVPASARDLADPAIRDLALAGEYVPAGKYARAALRSLGAWDAVKARVVTGDNVRATLAWVAGGEAEAAVVYATDAKVEPRARVAFTFPPGSHPAIVYPAAALKGSTHVEDAKRFLAFCQSAEAQAVFAAAGFLPAPS